jgi:hypothetical protein
MNAPSIPTLDQFLNAHCIEVDCQGESVWIAEYHRLYLITNSKENDEKKC